LVRAGGVFGEVFVSREQAFAVHRARVLEAIVQVVCERGFAGASVGSVSERARVSRRSFYKVFDSLEDCFLAVLDEGAWYVGVLISRAFAREQSWLDGVRGALAALLGFLDSDPALARVLLVEAAAAGSWARERREAHVVSLTSLIEERWAVRGDSQAHPFVSAGVIASLLGVLHTQLVADREEPLLALLGPLMGLVTSPYLDRQGVRGEIARGESLARELLAGRGEQGYPGHVVGVVEVPALLLDPRAHRARACLLYLFEQGGLGCSPSNRQVAEAVGVAGRTQMSALLARLQRAGLLVKCQSRPGGANAWSLTQKGLQVAHALAGERHERSLDATSSVRRAASVR
jgi:AcrR family transcriptional regulator